MERIKRKVMNNEVIEDFMQKQKKLFFSTLKKVLKEANKKEKEWEKRKL